MSAAPIVSGEQDTILPSPLKRRVAEKTPNAHHLVAPDDANLVSLATPDSPMH